MAFITALVVALTSVWGTWRFGRERAAVSLVSAALAMLLVAVLVSLQLCECSNPLRAESMPDVRFALSLAAGFGLAGMARLLVRSGA